jgi:hypothetical protein
MPLATATPGIRGDLLILSLQMLPPLRLLQISPPAAECHGGCRACMFSESLVVGNLSAFRAGSLLTRVLDCSDDSPSGFGMVFEHSVPLTVADTPPERSKFAPKPTINSWGSRREEAPRKRNSTRVSLFCSPIGVQNSPRITECQ